MSQTRAKQASREPDHDPVRLMKQRHSRTASFPNDHVPAPDNGGHARSAAAHLGDAKGHTKAAGSLRQTPTLREPPMEISRVGKQHR